MRLAVACVAVLVAAALTSGVAGAGVDGGSAEAGSVKRVRFIDARGEDPDAPDISAVVVSNTVVRWAPASAVTFRVAIPNRPELTEDMRVALWIDADDDRATGLAPLSGFAGVDYYVNWDPKLRPEATLLRCRKKQCTTVDARTFRFSYAGGATFSLRADDLGDTKRFRFTVRAYSGVTGTPETGFDFTGMRMDAAPGEGVFWRYRLALARPTNR